MNDSTRKVKLARGDDAPYDPVRASCAVRCAGCGMVLFTSSGINGSILSVSQLADKLTRAECACTDAVQDAEVKPCVW